MPVASTSTSTSASRFPGLRTGMNLQASRRNWSRHILPGCGLAPSSNPPSHSRGDVASTYSGP